MVIGGGGISVFKCTFSESEPPTKNPTKSSGGVRLPLDVITRSEVSFSSQHPAFSPIAGSGGRAQVIEVGDQFIDLAFEVEGCFEQDEQGLEAVEEAEHGVLLSVRVKGFPSLSHDDCHHGKDEE